MASRSPRFPWLRSVRSIIALTLTGFAVFVGGAVAVVATLNKTLDGAQLFAIIVFVLGLSQTAVVFYFNKSRGE